LAKDPDQRFQTARDLKAALTWALDNPIVPVAGKPRRTWWIAAAALAMGILAGWGVPHLRLPLAEIPPYRLQIVPPEGCRFTFGSNAGGIALSPDGRTAAFVASGGEKNGLWLRPLDGTAARLIAGSPSPIASVAVPRGAAWTVDGQILVGAMAGSLVRVPALGGTPTPLTTLDASRGENFHRWPQALPGGRFLYFARSGQPGNSGMYAASLANPREAVRVLATDTNALYARGGDGREYLLWLGMVSWLK
jgi:serine/threonine-protein kinase